MRILDTHLGSGSSRIAAHKAGLDFTGIEIDKEYFDLSEKRFINGEVNFNDEERGLWLPMCIVIFGEQAKVGTFSVLNYR